MSREEFNNHSFSFGEEFTYDGESYPIISINFKEALIGIDQHGDINDLSWVRCESGDIA